MLTLGHIMLHEFTHWKAITGNMYVYPHSDSRSHSPFPPTLPFSLGFSLTINSYLHILDHAEAGYGCYNARTLPSTQQLVNADNFTGE
jgi:hypothetical protein